MHQLGAMIVPWQSHAIPADHLEAARGSVERRAETGGTAADDGDVVFDGLGQLFQQLGAFPVLQRELRVVPFMVLDCMGWSAEVAVKCAIFFDQFLFFRFT